MERRPLKTRSKEWVSSLNKILLRSNVKPDDISALGIVFALIAGACFVLSQFGAPVYLLFAAVFIQLRLLCNMMDGMLAIEGNLKTKMGEVFNELPDRYEDTIILVCAGYAIGDMTLGWAAAAFAILTAYLRTFGGSLGTKQYFAGPMAKPHRMFVMTVAAIGEFILSKNGLILTIGLYIVLIGSIITCTRRRMLIIRELKSE